MKVGSHCYISDPGGFHPDLVRGDDHVFIARKDGRVVVDRRDPSLAQALREGLTEALKANEQGQVRMT